MSEQFPSTENSTSSLAGMLATSQVVPETSSGGKAFIRFDFESGDYAFGKEQEDITGEIVVVNLKSFTHGWTLWSGGKPTKVAVPFTQPLPAPMASIGADTPSEARSFEARFEARFEDDADTVLDFSSNSYGGRKGCDTLLDQAKIRAASGEAEFLFPVVKLESESYANAKRGGKLTYNPSFTVIDWANEEGTYASATPKLESKPEAAEEPAAEAPKKRRRKAAEA